MTGGGRSAWRFMALCLSLSAVAVAATAAAGEPGRDPMLYFFHQSFGDLKEELEIARAEGKQAVFVMFDDPECPWCLKMKKTVLSRPQVQDYYRAHFRPIRVDTRGDAPMYDFQGRETTGKILAAKVYRVRATPVVMFFDLDGKPITRYTGPTRGVDEFLWLGEYVAGGHFKTKKFVVYKQERLAALKSK